MHRQCAHVAQGICDDCILTLIRAAERDAAAKADVDIARLRAKLERARDFIKFAANSEGGIVAEIDATLAALDAKEE